MDYNNNNQFNQNNQMGQNPQYYQNPQYMNMMYAQQLEKERRDNKAANTLCIASIICTILGMMSIPLIGDFDLPYSIAKIMPGFLLELFGLLKEMASGIAVLVGSTGHIAGFVLMIVARVKYPKNTFAKVLMWIYIIGVILYVLMIVLIIAACAYIFSQCHGF